MAKTLGWVFGIVFVLVGILGMAGTGLVGETGTFMTNTSHDVVHLVTGILFILF